MKKTFIILIIFSFSILGYGCTTKKNSDTLKVKSDETSLNSTIEDREMLSEEYLLGHWESVEEDWSMEIVITKNSKTSQLELKILYPQKEAEIYKSVNKENNSFFNSDNSIEYKFLTYENKLLMAKFYAQSDPQMPNAIRPWILEKNDKDISSGENKPKLSKEYLLGSWQSPEEMKGTYKTASGYSSYSNEDNSVRYKFSLNGNQLYMQKVFTSNEPNTVGMVRPWKLDRVNE
ncbi:hypothetical protein [Vagococcus fluvialis]|uniref:hypothetical protein n=1 Tax=Vagococcus fluvialis TaxID=2738 RepID=UPI001A8DC4CB|nr:hypothetical protein [Vagococcus fluvialis]MBO0438404.1 hypothetical protein [Vagococcus fluvialis]